MKVFITRKIPQAGLALLEKEGLEITQWEEKRELTEAEFIEHCKVADGIILSGRRMVNAAFFEQCSHLKVVSLLSIGYDNVDIEAATKAGVAIGNTPDVLSKSTAETAFLLMVATARKAFYHHKRIGNGQWGFFEPTAGLGTSLFGKTLGIFGLGNIGLEMARMCKGAYGMDVIYHNRGHNEKAEQELGARRVGFDTLLAQSDVLSVHANLNDENKGLFDAGTFAKMKNSALFINTARGGIHNEAHLKTALENGTIWGAGLDVTNPEPMDKSNPLLNMENVSILPHIGTAVKETRDAMAVLAAQNLIAGLKGEELRAQVTLL
ncbi:hydroxyacid dehydrogenase [Flavobacterium akiainvivens]|uniref:Hydroxyacid dehydrogenase n=1 Tax=Flavobacterium akiainvivens TaxID=1202724 RepID=A0A0M8MK68_9FLAO|nr:D-glycerate dehydrogenase [Flavobacterium akiainvivens]KOS07208.1 hydroxyacid dehydrogenase [Flavobacterium akiainvivens]SFQ78301.1 Lactate dehydrogenase [Flavobacterium akiainvivens]